jgi:GntR family transcriptional regulator of vanillate catabolism
MGYVSYFGIQPVFCFRVHSGIVSPKPIKEAPVMRQQVQATLRVREMILCGQLKPGQRVREAAIAEQLGISRTPVRQALPALAEEGLLTPAGRRGYAVRSFTIGEVDTALDIRAALEGMAARMLAERGAPKALLSALEACLIDGDALFAKRHFVQGDEFKYGLMNKRFHDAIINAAENEIISGMIRKLHGVPFVTPAVVTFDNQNLTDIYDILHFAHRTHHAIKNALENGQGTRAEALFKEHVYARKLRMSAVQDRVEPPLVSYDFARPRSPRKTANSLSGSPLRGRASAFAAKDRN